MKIRSIHLQNFRSYIDNFLDLETLTVGRGGNGTGKSTIEMAFEIALAGRTETTSTDGKGSSALIRAGASKAMISLAIEDGQENRLLKCALTDGRRAVVVSNPSDPQYGLGTEYAESLMLQRDVLSCLISNRYFVSLKEDEQKDVLARIILPKAYEWPDWVKPAANGLKINWAKTPFEVIGEAYEAAFKARTEVNRDLKNFRIPEGDTTLADQLEEVSLKLGARRTELDAAKKQKYEAEATSRAQAQTMSSAQQRLDAAKARVEREQAVIPGIEAMILSPAKLKELEKVAKNAEKAAKLESDRQRLEINIDLNKDAMTRLSFFAENCPTCGSVITQQLVDALVKPLKTERDRLDEEKNAAVDARKALGNPSEAKTQVEAHNRATEDLKRSQARVADDQTVIQDAEAALSGLKPVEVNTVELDKTIGDLSERITRGEEAVAKARAAKDLKGRKEAAEIELKGLQARQATLNKLLDYFGVDGVKAELLSSTVGSFTDRMNEVLGKWNYHCQLSIEPYVFAIVFLNDNGETVPIALKHLSRSQRFRFATAFQVALAQTSGYRFVISDESDLYDALGRSKLFEALTSGDLEQVIVLGTDERTFVPDVPNSAFYLLNDIAEAGRIPTTQVRRLLPATEEAA